MNRAVSALLSRLRRPVYWAAFLLLYLPFAGSQYRNAIQDGTLAHLEGWLLVALQPALIFGGGMWLAPAPWEWRGVTVLQQGFWRSAFVAVLFCTSYLVALVLFGAWLQGRIGVPVPLRENLIFNLVLFAPIMVLVGGLSARHEAQGFEKEAARMQAQEAQTRLLQSQLHPHVLFNAINGITELSRVDPAATERCLVALSDLLRKLLKASKCATVLFSEERQLAADYLVLEGLRLGSRLNVVWDLDPNLDTHELPPLLLQPLVENAIKHGITPSMEGGEIRIEGAAGDTEMRLCVRNTGHWSLDTRLDGIGIWNLRSRLELASNGKANFRLEREGEWTVAEIRYPILSSKSTLDS